MFEEDASAVAVTSAIQALTAFFLVVTFEMRISFSMLFIYPPVSKEFFPNNAQDLIFKRSLVAFCAF
ncbi:hypothetical protein OK016_28675 [Vibrio chagasii]|nr:hypothetical protein [Vibrio chagasii]